MKRLALSLAVPILGLTFLAQVIDISIGIPRSGTGGAAVSTLLTDLVAYWKLDELSGTRAKTAGSCSSCDLSAVNAPGVSGGAGSYGLLASTTGPAYLERAATTGIGRNANGYTIAVWFNSISTLADTRGIVSHDQSGTGTRDWAILGLNFYAFNTAGASVTVTHGAVTGQRTLLICWFDPSSGKASCSKNNATQIDSAVLSGDITTASNPANFDIGAQNFASPFAIDATIDLVAIYQRVLISEERTLVWNNGRGLGNCTNLATAVGTGVSCYNLDEASGSRADSWGSNTMTAVNAPGRTAGLVENSMGLSANFISTSTQYLSRADNPDLSLGGVNASFTAWINQRTTVNEGIITKFIGDYALDIASGNIRFFCQAGAGGIAIKAAPSLNEWGLVYVEYDNSISTATVYVNNIAGTPTVIDTCIDATGSFQIGARNASLPFNGNIDSPGFWKRILTSSERTALFNAGAGVEYPWSSIVYLFSNPNIKWADIPILDRQRMIYAKTGVIVPESMFPSFSRMN